MHQVTLSDLSHLLGWRGHSAFFNSKLFGFPEPVAKNSDGDNLYIYEDIVMWDRERPLDQSKAAKASIIFITNSNINAIQ